MTTFAMPFFPIDTLHFSQRMQDAGMQKQIADELAKAMNETQGHSFEVLATRQDVKEVVKDLEYKIEATRHDINKVKSDMELMRKDIIIKLGSLITLGVSVLAVLIKYPI